MVKKGFDVIHVIDHSVSVNNCTIAEPEQQYLLNYEMRSALLSN